MTETLCRPDSLLIAAPDGRKTLGCDQEWYALLWRRRAGCGPATAANLLTYLHRAGRLALPDGMGPEHPLALLDFCWDHITPTMRGLNTTRLFREGMDGLLARIGSPLRCRVLDVPAQAGARPGAAQAAAFSAQGLAAGCPVAFLNLSNGDVAELDEWHWVTVLGLDDAQGFVKLDILDNTHRLRIGLDRWLATTARGGGFVYLTGPGCGEGDA